MRLLRTIGGIDFTGQERAALNKLTVSMISLLSGSLCGTVGAGGRWLRQYLW